ncbi:MAG: hypothetical protein PHV34_03245 [Verrucomicrobiae bacterium]|nr:hypothetical protein [Verrucomicrobiae bacterium]
MNARIFIVPVLLFAVAQAQMGWSCGLTWRIPTNHFDSINERAFLSYWEQIGEISLDKGEKLPLIVNFRSDQETPSRHLGANWLLALVESRIYALNSRQFVLIQPDGWNRHFNLRKEGDTVLRGGGGWLGEIRDTTISIWPGCGWKFTYVKGKLASMQSPKNQRIDLMRIGDKVTEVRCDGSVVLRFESDPRNGETKALVFNGKRLEIELGAKPRVAMADGKRVVKGEERGLVWLVNSDGPTERIEYGVDSDGQPTMKLVQKTGAATDGNANDGAGATNRVSRCFAWDAGSRHLLRDNDWQYTVKPGEKPGDYAAIERRNAQGSEFWHLDKKTGLERVRGMDGVEKITTWFTKGVLAKKIRKVELVDGKTGKKTVQTQFSYDDKGRVMRDFKNGRLTFYKYDQRGRPIEAVRDDKVVWKKEYDSQGRLIVEETAGKEKSLFRYLPNGEREETRIPADLKNGGWAEDKKIVLFYNQKGRCLSRRWPNGNLWTYELDEKGREKNLFVNGSLYTSIEYDAGNRVKMKRTYQKDGKTIKREQQFEYANDGRESVETVKADGKVLFVIKRHFDENGRLYEQEGPEKGVYRFTYGKDGHCQQTFVAASSGFPSASTP